MTNEEIAYKPIEKIGKIPMKPLQKEFAWLIDNSIRIMVSGFANVTTSKVFYVVPDGKILYITNLTLNGDNSLEIGRAHV